MNSTESQRGNEILLLSGDTLQNKGTTEAFFCGLQSHNKVCQDFDRTVLHVKLDSTEIQFCKIQNNKPLFSEKEQRIKDVKQSRAFCETWL